MKGRNYPALMGILQFLITTHPDVDNLKFEGEQLPFAEGQKAESVHKVNEELLR